MSTRYVWRGSVVCVCVMLCWMGEARVDSAFMSDAMDSNIQKLIKQHKLQENKRSWGSPVFPAELLNSKLEDSEKAVLMGLALEVYEKILGQMAGQEGGQQGEGGQEGDQTRAQILKRIKEIQKHYFPRHEDVGKVVKKLWNIKTDDVQVQSNSLWELKRVYEEASRLGNHFKRLQMRRRRHAQRTLTPRG
ncbi:interferon gamma 1 [Osmerus eperlanus]|uniref:interferon gamma 1 n=1 Tax=Osmerus eperlanus TaxID=29151 RepID=UPI002E0F0EBC